MIATEIEMFDANGKPSIRHDLPSMLRVGDRIRLRFRIKRALDGRNQEMAVDGEYRVVQASLDTSRAPALQRLSVESATGAAPVWKSVRGAPARSAYPRPLTPTRFPPTTVR